MSIKTRIKLLVVCAVCMAVSLFAGCTIGEQTVDSFLTEKGAKEQSVTYYANGGYFNTMTNMVVKEVYYVENAFVIVDFSNTQNLAIDRSGGYVFNGWYYAELDGEGNPVFEDEKNKIVKLTDTPVDEWYQMKKGDHLYVGAKWSLDIHLNVVLVSEKSVTGSDGKTYETGANIAIKNFSSNGTLTLTDSSPWASADHTFLQYYYDIDCTKPYNGERLTKPTGEDAEDLVMYAKYIEGVWTIVKNTDDVLNMFNDPESVKSYYIFDNIDCSGASLMLNPGSFNLSIEGNGHTISGLNFSLSGISGNTSYAIFGNIGQSANVRNLTIKDVGISVTVRSGRPSVYLICSGIEDGAEPFENLVIDGVEMQISYPENDATIENIQYVNETYESDNWIYGGVKDDGGYDTDEAFLAVYGGITVTNAKLSVNNSAVADVE